MKTKFFMPRAIAMAVFCVALTGFVRAENQSGTSSQQQDQSQTPGAAGASSQDQNQNSGTSTSGTSTDTQQQNQTPDAAGAQPSGQSSSTSGTSTSSSTASSGDRMGTSQQVSSEMPKDANKASKLIGMEVKNQQGERLGKVKDIAIDLDSGRVAYVVVRKSGGLGSEKTIAVPLQAFSKPQGGQTEQGLVLNIDKQKFESAKTFTQSEWPSMQIPQDEVAFWQIEVYEPAGAANKQGQQGQQGQQEQQGQQQQPQATPDQQNQQQTQPQSSPDQQNPQSQPKPQIK